MAAHTCTYTQVKEQPCRWINSLITQATAANDYFASNSPFEAWQLNLHLLSLF